MLKTKINLYAALIFLVIVGVAIGAYMFAVSLFTAAAVTSVCILVFILVLLLVSLFQFWLFVRDKVSEWNSRRAL